MSEFMTDEERKKMKKRIDAYRKKYPKTVTEQILLNTVIQVTWTEGKGDPPDRAHSNLHNELLYEINKAIGKKYPITRFQIMQIDFKVVKKPRPKKKDDCGCPERNHFEECHAIVEKMIKNK